VQAEAAARQQGEEGQPAAAAAVAEDGGQQEDQQVNLVYTVIRPMWWRWIVCQLECLTGRPLACVKSYMHCVWLHNGTTGVCVATGSQP
jgi:hypothetical protein